MNLAEIYSIIEKAKLSRPQVFRERSFGELSRFYNGVGADWFPEWLRVRISAVLERLQPLAFIHDIEFGTSAPNYWAFTVAQLRWAYNAFLLTVYYKRYRLRFLVVALLCAAVCQIGGYRGYQKGLKE